MQTLPAEILIVIGQYLRPVDLGRLAKTNSRFMRLAQDEHLFSRLYYRDFARLIDEKPIDMLKALSGTKLHKQNRLRKKLIELDMTSSDKGKAELRRMKHLKLEADWKWRHLYITLYLTKLNMLETMDELSGINDDKMFSHRAGTPDYRLMYYTVFDQEILENPHLSLLHHNEGVGLVHGKAPFKFIPIDSNMIGVKLKHLNFLHQIAIVDAELGRRDVELELELGHDLDDYGRGPPDSKISLCHEGMAVWNSEEEVYKLVYPMLALRQLFLYVREENDIKTFDAQENARDFLNQSPIIRCQILNSDVCRDYPSQIYLAVVAKLKEAELEPLDCKLIDATTLEFTCQRVPVWKYRQGQCVFTNNGYDQVKRCPYKIECLDPAVNKVTPFMIEKSYCAKHNADNPRVTKYRHRNRAAARTREYFSYPKRPNLELSDCQLSIGTLKIEARFARK